MFIVYNKVYSKPHFNLSPTVSFIEDALNSGVKLGDSCNIRVIYTSIYAEMKNS
jgi:hypothetical protein